MWAKRTDANQAEIVKALRKAGVSVQSLHRVGQGVPDLLCGIAQKTFLLEVKREKEKPNADQVEFLLSWRGHVAVVRSPEEALRAVGL